MIKKERNFEIDFLRGVAVIMMIYFHTIFDLKEFFSFDVNYSTGYNYYLAKIGVTIFIVISGISSSLSKNNLRRGLKVFVLGMLITSITIFIPNVEIYFGILHFMGISMIFAYLLLKLNNKVFYPLIFLISASVIFINYWADSTKITHNYFMMFGFTNENFRSADYYPLIPWFGVFLIGLLIGKIYYKKIEIAGETEGIYVPEQIHNGWRNFLNNNPVNFVGRNSLIIYFVHQPIILLLIFMYKAL